MGAIKKRFTIQTYNIGIVDASVLDNGLLRNKIKWLKHSYKDRFFADPFLWDVDNEFYYILVEELCFFEEYGKISLLKVDKKNFSLVSKKIIIKEPYHLSFPFCIEGEEFIIPESIGGKVCKKYHVSKYHHTIVDTMVIANEGIVDPILFSNHDVNWLLGGKKNDPSGELYIFKKDIKADNYVCSDEVCNPVISDRSHARNAGRIFSFRGKLIRPAQDCTQRYGYGIKLMEINRIDNGDYEETEYLVLNGEGNPPFDETLHTFNYYNDFALVDGSKDIFAVRNVFYKAKKFVNRIH